jgi:hypothetical protein
MYILRRMEYLDLDTANPVFNNAGYLNGRVNAVSKVDNYKLDLAVNKATEHQINLISRNLNCTEVSKMYFSMDNINLLQVGIRNKILNDTGGEINIGRQKDDELRIIMRSIYFQHGKNRTDNIKEQVLDLNTRVISWCVPEIISNVKQSQRYIEDISRMPVPLERSTYPSIKGANNLDVTSRI